jgi:hypothetical protein
MNKTDFKIFCSTWAFSQEIGVNGKELSDKAMCRVFEMLMPYPLSAVLKAFDTHNKTNRFAPTPADLIEILESHKPRHLGANEAWSLALKSMDEFETVVLTDEIMNARAIAWNIYADGDEIGARMAFREAYEREIKNAGTPTWKVSLGFDTQRREEAIRQAVDKNLLPKSELLKIGVEVDDNIGFERLVDLSKYKAKKEKSEAKPDPVEKPDYDQEEILERETRRNEFEKHRAYELEKVEKRLGRKVVNEQS